MRKGDNMPTDTNKDVMSILDLTNLKNRIWEYASSRLKDADDFLRVIEEQNEWLTKEQMYEQEWDFGDTRLGGVARAVKDRNQWRIIVDNIDDLSSGIDAYFFSPLEVLIDNLKRENIIWEEYWPWNSWEEKDMYIAMLEKG